MCTAIQRVLARAVAVARASGNLLTLFNSLVTLAEFQRRQGRLHQAVASYREAGQVAPEPVGLQGIVNGAAYHFGLGNILREWNDLDVAERHLVQGQAMVRRRLQTNADAMCGGYTALARLQQTSDNHVGALASLHEFEAQARERNSAAYLFGHAAAVRAQLALMHGDLAAALQWADTSDLRPNDDLDYLREPEYLTLTRVRIAQGRRDPSGPVLRDALSLLDRLLAAAEASMRLDSVIEMCVLRALALEAQDNGTIVSSLFLASIAMLRFVRRTAEGSAQSQREEFLEGVQPSNHPLSGRPHKAWY